MELKIVAYQSSDYHDVVSLRSKILRAPLGLKFSRNDLKADQEEIIIGLFDQSKLLGCVQLRPIDKNTIKLRQMAIDTPFQRQGLGQKLINFAEGTARKKNYKTIVLHARKEAVNFYKKLNYRICSELFEEVGIPHFKMQKTIS